MMDYNRINNRFSEFARWKAIEEEARAEREKLKAEIISMLDAEGLESYQGDEHKASISRYDNAVVSAKDVMLQYPEVFAAIGKMSRVERLNFR